MPYHIIVVNQQAYCYISEHGDIRLEQWLSTVSNLRDIPARKWLYMQSDYDLWQAQQKLAENQGGDNAQRAYQTIKNLSEQQVAEVLAFAESLQAKGQP